MKSRAAIVALLSTVVLLPALAALQYRWLGTLSELEHRRMRSNLHWATERFCIEFDRDLSRLYYEIQSNLSRHDDTKDSLAEAYAQWSSSTPYPELVKSIHWIELGRGGKAHELVLGSGKLKDSEPPQWLASLEDELSIHLEDRSMGHAQRTHEESESLSEVDPLRPDVPGLLVLEGRSSANAVAATLDRDVLLNRIFPERIREYFAAGNGPQYDFLIVDASHPHDVVYRSAPGLTFDDFDEPDEEQLLFGLRSRNRQSAERKWKFLVRHRAGSLEAAVSATRIRNLAVAFGALVLLGGSVFMLIVATRRAQALAHQQVEFVAGISHELRTPLAGISSLSENLADGVIRDAERSRQYGEAIHRESRRLGDMLERVLLFSRIESGNPYEMRSLDIAETLEEAIESTQSWTKEKTAVVENDLPEGLPPVHGNPRSLKMALQNILANAVKFSPDGSTVSVRAAATDRNVQIAVKDEGLGIPTSELSRIFEPFFRGSNAREQQIEGSGLGLSIVKRILEAQGGRVTVKSELGKGTTVTIHLPIGEQVNDE